MWELRRKRALLLDKGHPDAGDYPLGYLLDEAALAVEQINGLMVTEAYLIQAAFASVQVKGGEKHFNAMVKGLQ